MFESVLETLDNPPTKVDRDKVPDLIQLIQNEQRLFEGFSNDFQKKFEIAGIDYVIYGDFTDEDWTTGEKKLIIKCIKTRGENVSESKSFPVIRFNRQEMNGTKIFESKVREILKDYSFIQEVGIVNKEQLSGINKWLEKKDNEIQILQSEVYKFKSKEDSLNQLKKTPPIVDAYLTIRDSNLLVVVELKNQVPIEVKFDIYTNGFDFGINQLINGPELKKVYPHKLNKVGFTYSNLNELYYPEKKEQDYEINLILDYNSIFYPESLDNKLKGGINKKFILNIAQKKVIPKP